LMKRRLHIEGLGLSAILMIFEQKFFPHNFLISGCSLPPTSLLEASISYKNPIQRESERLL
jgi:hypothetical protein